MIPCRRECLVYLSRFQCLQHLWWLAEHNQECIWGTWVAIFICVFQMVSQPHTINPYKNIIIFPKTCRLEDNLPSKIVFKKWKHVLYSLQELKYFFFIFAMIHINVINKIISTRYEEVNSIVILLAVVVLSSWIISWSTRNDPFIERHFSASNKSLAYDVRQLMSSISFFANTTFYVKCHIDLNNSWKDM